MEEKKKAAEEISRGGDKAAVSADLGALCLADDEAPGADEEAEAEQVPDDDDSSLFDEPPPRPDCDICMLPLPIDTCFNTYMPCCGKTVCSGCDLTSQLTIERTNQKRIEKAKKERLPPPPLLEDLCPFCRIEAPDSGELLTRLQKRVKLGDSNAVGQMALYCRDGDLGVPVDEEKSLELAHQAASLGSVNTHLMLGIFYSSEDFGVNSTALAHFKAAAKSGCVRSHAILGEMEFFDGNKKNAVRHWRISAAAGHKPSVDGLIRCFQEGLISKESLEKSMRAKHEACQAMRSEDRDLALKRMIQRGDDVESYY